jgi:hypothetical protein
MLRILTSCVPQVAPHLYLIASPTGSMPTRGDAVVPAGTNHLTHLCVVRVLICLLMAVNVQQTSHHNGMAVLHRLRVGQSFNSKDIAVNKQLTPLAVGIVWRLTPVRAGTP